MSQLPAVVVLISGQGRNLQALIERVADGAMPARIAAVISNRADAPGLARARATGLHTEVLLPANYPDRAAYDAALAEAIAAQAPAIIAMAGFMRVLGAAFIDRFAGRMLNIHPSLLPRHRGLHTHRRVLAAGDREHGASVHFVTAELDSGPCVIQGRFTVRPEDDEARLAARVMREVELKIYPQAVAWMARGELALHEGRVRFRNQVLRAPLELNDLEPEFR